MKYASTFGSGWQTIIKKILEEKNTKIIDLLDGLVIFETKEINTYPCFNNMYLLIDSIKVNSNDFNKNVLMLSKKIKINYKVVNECIKNFKKNTFKIIGLDEGKPTRINYNEIKSLESSIIKNTSMKVSNKPDIEFIFMKRNEGYLYFLLKLTKDRKTEKYLQKGELRPEVCFLMSKLADIKEESVVLDPFCGTASIPKAIIKHFKYNMIFAIDNNEEKIVKLRKEYKKNKKNFYIKKGNALDLNMLENNFIDLIITDPPWNIYDKKEKDFKKFYSDMLKEFYRVLKENGKIVLLMGNTSDFEKALNKTLFNVENKLSVLINGKKASVYLITK